ncbi:hypothetical protein [Halobaculum magnesiiphilum]|uniref:Uncharacterized protein n=1 Tax=Halobaculum magnesiiphilum TaxID=1017351 RepID=A0A8T8WHS3_9EURY|nr:hypothetical protein [Halobaculum magnesiiphilum]QZP39390.1 hypothetical protein K6T50_15910 [Halobaculum magnesiiphilum]
MIDLDDYPDGTDKVIMAIKELTPDSEEGVYLQTEDRVSRREIAEFVGEKKDWARYRLEELVEGHVVDVTWYESNARLPERLYCLTQRGEEFARAEEELEKALGEVPGNVRVHHLREFAGEVSDLRRDVHKLRRTMRDR